MADGRIIIETSMDNKGLEKGVTNARAQAAKLAAEYKKQGMSASEAFKKAWSEIERDSAEKGNETANNWRNSTNKINDIAKTGLKAFTSVITVVGSAIGGLAGVATKYNSQMEDYFANFTVLLGSATEATKHVEDLKKFAAKTPFEMTGLADASKQLLSFGINVDDVMPDLQMLGDISLGNQERFKGLALVFAQVASAGKLTGQDLLQFINQGFNPLQVIAEKTGKSMSELKEEMSDGKVSYEMVADAMKTATSEGGKFYQGMEVQSQTLSGMWSTLKDDTMSLIGGAFKPFSDILKTNVMPALQGIVKQMSAAFDNPGIQDSILNIATGLGDLAVKISELVSKWLPKIIEGFSWMLDHSSEIAAGIIGIGTALMVLNVANVIMGLVKAFQAAKLATEGLTVAQWLLNTAMLANPIGLIIAAIAGLVAAFIYLWNTNEGFRNAVTNAWNAILNSGKAVWGWLVKFFTEDIPNAFNSVKEWFAGLPGWFASLWSQVTAKFQEWGTNITNFFTQTIPVWIKSIFNWFNELPYKIGYALGYVIAKITQWGKNTWNYLITNVPKWIESVVKFFSELPGKIWTWLLNTISKIVQWGQQTYWKMVEAVSKAVNAVIEWFAKLPGRLWEWLLNTIKKVIQFGKDLGSKAREAGGEMVKNIIGAVKDLPSKFLDIGVNIVKGIWNGITSMGSWIHDKVTGFFKGMLDGAKEANDIHSPSRLYRDKIGAMMAQGVGVGFESETSRVEKDIRKNLADIVSNINIDEVSAKLNAAVYQEQARTSRAITAGFNKVVNNTNTITNDNGVTQNVTIVNPERTPAENARALKKVGRDLAFGY